MIDQPAQDGGTFFTAPVCDRDHTHRILRSVVCTHHRSTDFPPTSLFPGQGSSGQAGMEEPVHIKSTRLHQSRRQDITARLPDIESEQSKVTTVLRAMSNAKAHAHTERTLRWSRTIGASNWKASSPHSVSLPCLNIWPGCDGQTSSAPDANLKPFIIPSMTPMYCGSCGCSAIFTMTTR